MIYSQYCCYKVSPEFEIILKYVENELCFASCSKNFVKFISLNETKDVSKRKWKVKCDNKDDIKIVVITYRHY